MRKLHITKVEFTNGTRLLVVTNEKNKVLTAGAFDNPDDAETAANTIGTLLLRLDLIEKKPDVGKLPPMVTLDALLANCDAMAKKEATKA